MNSERVVEAMRRIAPLELAETAWDNVGILVENPRPLAGSKTVLLTIDLTDAVLQEAVDQHASVIVAYHPPIFRPLKSLRLDDGKAAIVLKAVVNGISIYSPHTALDAAQQGVNDWLIDGLTTGIAGTKAPIKPTPSTTGSAQTGMGRVFRFDDSAKGITVDELVLRTKKHLGLPQVRLAAVSQDHVIRSIGVCAGSGASLLAGLKVDAFVTGELGHHEALAANALGTSVVLGEHTNTERGYLRLHLQGTLQEMLQADQAFADAKVIVSQIDRDPLVIV